MTLFIKIVFILSFDVLIFNLPESHGIQNNQGYHVSTISQVLTPSERLMYVCFGTLPNRIYYSYEKRCYVVRGQKGYYKNDLRRKKGKRYKTIPRWQYYLSKVSPMSLIQSGLEFASIGKALMFGGGLGGFGDDDLDDGTEGDVDGDVDGNVDGDVNGDVDGGTGDGSDDAKKNEKEPGILSTGMDTGMGLMSPLFNLFGGSNDANNDNNNGKKDDDNDKNNEKNSEEPGLLSKGMDMGMGLMSPLFSLFGGSNDANNNEKKDDKEGDKPAESQSYMDMAKNVLDSDAVGVAKDVLQSDAAKDAVKTGISLFVPGGPAIVAAMDAAQKYQNADAAVDKVEDKLPFK